MGLEDEGWPSPEEFLGQHPEIIQKVLAPRPKQPKMHDMEADHWRVMCAFCNYNKDRLPTRVAAIAHGHSHVADEHADDDEWSFRVQGIREGE